MDPTAHETDPTGFRWQRALVLSFSEAPVSTEGIQFFPTNKTMESITLCHNCNWHWTGQARWLEKSSLSKSGQNSISDFRSGKANAWQ